MKKAKTTWYIVGILFVICLLLLARTMHKGGSVSSNQEGNQTEAVTEKATEAVANTEEADANEDSLEKGYFFAELENHASTYETDEVEILDYQKDFYQVTGKNTAICQTINDAILAQVDAIEAEYSTVQEDAESGYENYIEIEGGEGDFYPYEFHISSKLLRNDERVFSFIFYTEVFLGGAHGNVMSYCMNFDSQTGALLSLSDLRDQDSSISEEEWTANFESQLLSQCQEREEELFPEYADYLPDLLKGEGNWALTAEGIQFVADEYELASYAAGMQVFTIPTEELEGFNSNYAFVE